MAASLKMASGHARSRPEETVDYQSTGNVILVKTTKN